MMPTSRLLFQERHIRLRQRLHLLVGTCFPDLRATGRKASSNQIGLCLPRDLFAGHPSGKIILGDLQPIRCASTSQEIKDARDDSSPTGLMTGSQARAIVPVKIFVEQDVISPVRIVLKLLGSSIHWTLA